MSGHTPWSEVKRNAIRTRHVPQGDWPYDWYCSCGVEGCDAATGGRDMNDDRGAAALAERLHAIKGGGPRIDCECDEDAAAILGKRGCLLPDGTPSPEDEARAADLDTCREAVEEALSLLDAAEAREARLREALDDHWPIPSTEPDDTPVLSCGGCGWDSYSKLAWADHIRAALSPEAEI